MIDLNLKPKQKEEEPIGMIILTLIPFAVLFLALLEWGL